MPAAEKHELRLTDPVTAVVGVGPERAVQLERMGIRTVEELLLHRPRRHEDRRHGMRIVELREKGPATVRGRVVAQGVKRFRGGSRSVYELVLDDGTARLHCRWWNMPYLDGHFAIGDDVMAFGRLVELKPRTMDHPETEVLEAEEGASIHLDRIVPVYPLTEGLPQRWLRSRLWALVATLAPKIAELRPDLAVEGLPSRSEAVRWLHFPEDPTDVEVARQRLAYDEFIALQWEIQSRRQRLFQHVRGLVCPGDNRWIRPFLARLGFKLTEAQTAVLREIRRDLSEGRPMRRLVQGDVGSGKTVVAACAALMVLESGLSVALMAPTEILARQHWERFREWFEPLGIPVAIRTGGIQEGGDSAAVRCGLAVGTHALIGGGYAPEDLGLVIIDEQHKFGVSQRETLVKKGHFPHLLVMTATPIPRTLALTLYGDLDCSVMRQGPPGRGRVRTWVRSASALEKVWAFVREQVTAGRQAYVVYARVDDESGGEVKAVTREWGRLKKAFAPFEVGLLHGRLSTEEKDAVMSGFRSGAVSVLVATLVIEVGIDVANATVMVIENAEQFGLAQLHQLRGRIGRGGQEGHCILVAGKETEEARARLQVLEASADGFQIAEADLRMRGPGEMLGQAQSGLPSLRFGDLVRDAELLERARVAVAARLSKGTGAGNHG